MSDLVKRLRGELLDCNCCAHGSNECCCDTHWPEDSCREAADRIEQLEAECSTGKQMYGQIMIVLGEHRDELAKFNNAKKSLSKLMSECADLKTKCAELERELAETKRAEEDHRQQLRKEQLYVQELRKDAERYRHLRNNAQFQNRNGPGLYWYLPRFIPGTKGEQFDAAIDAAMGESK